jgi:hypothetical protein
MSFLGHTGDVDPEFIAAYSDWQDRATEAGRPVFFSLGTLLIWFTDLPALLIAVIALVVVMLGTFLGSMHWVQEHDRPRGRDTR